MRKTTSISAFLILVVLMLLSASPLAYAKILPNGQPDIRLDIGTRQMSSTEENLEIFYNDIGMVHQIFDEVMVPGLDRFLGEHWDELEGQDVEWVWMSYDVPDGMSISVGPVHGTVKIEDTSDTRLQMVNSIYVMIPPSWWYYPGGDRSHWLYSGLQVPNASARIAYLTYQTQDILTRHKSELITSVTVDEQGAQIDKMLPGISAVMFEDMSRISVGYGLLTEYANGMNLIVPLPPSAGSLYTPPDFELNDFILFAKSANKPLSISAELSTYAKVSNATLTYPDGTQVLLDPVRVESEKSESETDTYYHYLYGHYIESKEPSGIYKLFINASPTSSPPATNLDIFVREGYFPADYGSWSVETISVDRTGYAIRYKISENTQVGTISVDIPQKSVLITIENAKPDSKLIIELPRDLVDSLFENEADKSFLVTLSEDRKASERGSSVEYEEILANDQVRVLTIGLDEDTALVQIRGTRMVPEFGFVVLTAALMIGAVLATSRLVIKQ